MRNSKIVSVNFCHLVIGSFGASILLIERENGGCSLGIEFDEQGYCPAAQANKWGFINKAGNWIINPYRFLQAKYH